MDEGNNENSEIQSNFSLSETTNSNSSITSSFTHNYSMKDFAIDFVSGGISGMAMILSYFPLE